MEADVQGGRSHFFEGWDEAALAVSFSRQQGRQVGDLSNGQLVPRSEDLLYAFDVSST